MRALLRVLAIAALLALSGSSAGAATITIINTIDGPTEGFNDPTPASPVGGNPGTTVGAQRLFVFQYAANIWGALLPSTVEIKVNAQFSPQSCDATSGVLGGASAGSSHRNFTNAPFANTWYQQALANRLSGSDLSASSDINITFNSSIGVPTCLPSGWYYGVDGNEGGAIELLPVVLHELGHGLGFATITTAGVQQGTPAGPHIYDRFLFDLTQGLHWHEMASNANRAASSQNCSKLVWDGPAVVAASEARLGPRPLLRVNAPALVAGDYEVGLATFGGTLTPGGVTGNVVLANDGTVPPLNSPSNACEALVNAAAIAGNIAFVDRGTCAFTIKVKNAQNAGAIAVIVADSAAGCPPAGMSGSDATITIPVVRITQSDGATLRAQLGSGLNATLMTDPTLHAGAVSGGRVKVYTPVPFASGSSVSHWDVSAEPSLLMEPAITNGLSSDVDLTIKEYEDIGWFTGLVGVEDAIRAARLLGNSPNPFNPTTAIAFSLEREGEVELGVYDLTGRLVRKVVDGRMGPGVHRASWDGQDGNGRRAPAGVYLYRLKTAGAVESRHMVMLR